jgi:hypothetical protein
VSDGGETCRVRVVLAVADGDDGAIEVGAALARPRMPLIGAMFASK